MKKLLFLDFDGVLHPNFSQEGEYFSRTSYLMDALDGFAGDVEIIVSSSWRFHYWPAHVLLQKIPKAIAPLVTGFTPEVEPGMHQRYREICAYLKGRSESPDWRALDDAIDEFPKGCRELIECDGRIGLDDGTAIRLRRWLQA
jgi:hypothetical protein